MSILDYGLQTQKLLWLAQMVMSFYLITSGHSLPASVVANDAALSLLFERTRDDEEWAMYL